MKENLDIEKLFKDKFEGFEADVNPNLWSNIAKSVQSSSVSTTGLSIGVKSLIVASVVSIVGITTYFLGDFNQADLNKQQSEIIDSKIEHIKNQTEVNINNTPTIIAQSNDPIINTHEDEIVSELTKHQNNIELLDDEKEVHINYEENNLVNGGGDLSTNKENESAILTDDKKESSQNEQKEITTNTSTVANDLEKNIVYPSGKIESNITNNKFEYQFNANAVNNVKVIWHFGDGESSNTENPTHIYSSPGEYEVSLTVFSKDNEIYQEHQTIVIKSNSSIDNIPNVITPNGDRINDEFVIKSQNIDEFSIIIKDQNGNVVFESNDQNFAWDGTNLSGERVQNGIYIYYIFAKGTDDSIFKIPGQIYVR